MKNVPNFSAYFFKVI